MEHLQTEPKFWQVMSSLSLKQHQEKQVKLVARGNEALTIFQRNDDGKKQKSQTRLPPPSILKN
jgi:catechol-2,3-dioxygenase